MPEITLTGIEYGDEIEASFSLNIDDLKGATLRSESRSFVSALVIFPYEPEGVLQTNVDRRAHEHLLAHLKASVEGLGEILEK